MNTKKKIEIGTHKKSDFPKVCGNCEYFNNDMGNDHCDKKGTPIDQFAEYHCFKWSEEVKELWGKPL